jgi:hypothetical protein
VCTLKTRHSLRLELCNFRGITLHYITLHYITLRYVTLRYVTLRYIYLMVRHVLAIMQAELCHARIKVVSLCFQSSKSYPYVSSQAKDAMPRHTVEVVLHVLSP